MSSVLLRFRPCFFSTPFLHHVLTMKAWAPLERTSSFFWNKVSGTLIITAEFMRAPSSPNRILPHSSQEEQVALAFCVRLALQIKTGCGQGLLDKLRRQLSLSSWYSSGRWCSIEWGREWIRAYIWKGEINEEKIILYENDACGEYVDLWPLKCQRCGLVFCEQRLPQFALPPYNKGQTLHVALKAAHAENPPTFSAAALETSQMTSSLECRHIGPHPSSYIHTLECWSMVSPLDECFPILWLNSIHSIS